MLHTNQTTLTIPEEYAKEFLYTKFIPALHQLFLEKNPLLYSEWGLNSCRQTAIFGTHYIKQLLPNYKWYAYDGDFKDIIKGKEAEYNHAWIYGIDWKTKRKLLVDLSRKFQERLFIVVEENDYPKDHPEYIHTEILRKHKINIKQMMKEPEYYTELKGRAIIDILDEKMDIKGKTL